MSPPALTSLDSKQFMLPEPAKDLPPNPKVLIFDLDETLIHCVENIHTDKPDVLLEIDFPGDEPQVAGLNLRPYLLQCLTEANKIMQVGVFTASSQTYADAILKYIDPTQSLFSFRMYRHHCVKTEEGFFVKDLRVI